MAAFEQSFLANLVLVLDHFFVHRTRALEGKDGNALNEVRMLCDSILLNDSVMTANKTIKYDPARSVEDCDRAEDQTNGCGLCPAF